MGRSPSILIVDDDPHIREVVRFALQKEGFSSTEAGTGAEALSVFERAAREGPPASGGPVAILLIGDDRALAPWRDLMTAHLAEIPAASALAAVVRAALDSARLRVELADARGALTQRDAAVHELQRVAIALSAERNADTLQELILAKSRELTAADAGSLYLVEEDGEGGRHLRFQLAQAPDVFLERH